MWGTYSAVYSLMSDAPFVRELRQRHVRALQGLDTVLDAGCGPGLITAELVESRVRRVIGTDSDSNMLARAADRLRHTQNVLLYAADVHSLPFHDSFFDGYLSNNVLYYLEDADKAIAEIMRVTKQGGIISIASARPCNNVEVLLEALLFHLKSKGVEVPEEEWETFAHSNRKLQAHYRNLYEPEEISALLRKHGCSVVLKADTCYLDQNFFVVARR